MDDQWWSKEYQRFLDQSREAGLLADREQEQRHDPRFPLGVNIVWTAGDFQFAIVNLSISGVAFDANRSFASEQTITVRLSDVISLEARVVGCTPMETTPMFYLERFRVRCHFEDPVEGMRFLVMVKDLQRLRIDV